MAIIMNCVSLSQLEDEIRFDAQYYMPDNMLFEEEIQEFPTILLGNVALITDGQHGYFKLDEKSEIRQITAKCIKDGVVDKSKADHLSILTHSKNLRSSLKQNDILITTAGTIGQVGLVTDDIPPANIDQDIGRIAIHNSDVSPFFIWAFLQSKFGRFQIERAITGQIQTHLSLNKMKKLRIPLLSNHKEVEEIVSRFLASKKVAKESYVCAQQLLEAELGLDKISFQKPVGYTARFSEAMTGGRIDADYFQPQYSVARAFVQAYPGGYEPLLNCAASLRPNIDPSKAPNHLFNYIELSNINASLGIVEGFLPSLGANLPSRAKRQVKTGDVIASAVVGSVDKAAIIAEEQNGFLASTGFFHLRPKSVSPVYLLMLVRSQCVRMQFQQQSTGGILSAVPDSRLKHVIIPKLPVALQEEIDCLVTKSHSAKHTSDVLLERAKSCVAQLIEEAVKS